MNNEHYYSVTLEDYATVSFASGTKDYFGTLPEIEKFMNALKADSADDESLARTIGAFEEFKNGNAKAVHYAAYNETQLITPATVIDSVSYTLPTIEWEHFNIYGFPYKMRCSAAEITHVWLESDGEFFRAMKAKFTDLEYDVRLSDDDPERWEKIRNRNIWGYPHIIEYKKSCVYNTLAITEKRFETEEELKSDINKFQKDPKPDFSAFCDDIFGDG